MLLTAVLHLQTTTKDPGFVPALPSIPLSKAGRTLNMHTVKPGLCLEFCLKSVVIPKLNIVTSLPSQLLRFLFIFIQLFLHSFIQL